MALKRQPWPWSADTKLDRAQRLTRAYREALADESPLRAAAIDEFACTHGETWVVTTPWPYHDNDLLTREQVAEACHVLPDTVIRWHQRGLPYTQTPEGARVRVADLFAWQRARRLARRKPD